MLNKLQTVLTSKTMLKEDVCSLSFKLTEGEIDFVSGQYVMLRIANNSRLYSIVSNSDEKDKFDLIVRLIPNGIASSHYKNMEVGYQQDFFGPFGMFCLKKPEKPKIFLATGVGIAPYFSMFYKLNKEIKHYLFWGLKEKKDIYFEDRLKLSNLEVKICLSQEKNFNSYELNYLKGRINDNLNIFSNDFDYYVCGNNKIVDEMVSFLIKQNIDSKNIYFERY